MPSPFLYFAGERLSLAELSAARLDGDVVELGDAYLPADAVETPALRAGALRSILGDRLAATHLTAAWIHGARFDPPVRHTVQRAVGRRIHAVLDVQLIYRDITVPLDDLQLLGGVWVTTPTRTLADLVRVADDDHVSAARRMIAASPDARDGALEWLKTRRGVKNKRPGIALLAALTPDQEEVTR